MRWISPAVVTWVLAAGWGVSVGKEGDLVDTEALAPAGLVKYWQCSVPLKTNEALDRVSLEDETLYVLTDLGALYAVDARVGLVRWGSPIAEPPFRVFRPCHVMVGDTNAPRRTVVVSSVHLMLFHPRTGRLMAKLKLPFTPAGPPVAVGKDVYVGSVNSRYYALRPVEMRISRSTPKKKTDVRGRGWYGEIQRPGERLFAEADNSGKVREWQRDALERFGETASDHRALVVRWHIDTGGNVKGRPAVADFDSLGNVIAPGPRARVPTAPIPREKDKRKAKGQAEAESASAIIDQVAFIPSDGGKLFACRLAKKRRVWFADVPGEILVDPLIGSGMVYFASTGRSVYAVNLVNGRYRWQCHLPSALKRRGFLTPRRLYQPAEPTGVYAIDPMTGKLNWTFDQATHFLAEQADVVYLFEPGRSIHQIDAKTGKALRSLECPAATCCAGNTRDTTVYVASRDGRLMCLRPKGTPYLRRAEFDKVLAGSRAPESADEPAKKRTSARR